MCNLRSLADAWLRISFGRGVRNIWSTACGAATSGARGSLEVSGTIRRWTSTPYEQTSCRAPRLAGQGLEHETNAKAFPVYSEYAGSFRGSRRLLLRLSSFMANGGGSSERPAHPGIFETGRLGGTRYFFRHVKTITGIWGRGGSRVTVVLVHRQLGTAQNQVSTFQ